MDVNSELKDAQLEILDADKAHSANTKGMVWFNRATNKVKAMYNSVVEILATESYVDSQVSGSSSSLDTEGLVTTEQTTPATPATNKKRIYAKADDRTYEQGDDGIEHSLARLSDVTANTVVIKTSASPTVNMTTTGAIYTVPAGKFALITVTPLDNGQGRVYWVSPRSERNIYNSFDGNVYSGMPEVVPAGTVIYGSSAAHNVQLHIFFIG